MRISLKKLSLFTIFLLFSCSVDYSLLSNRQCDNEGKCLPGYICDRTTMTCIKEGSLIGNDTNILSDIIISDETIIDDIILSDTESDISCIPTNNGKETCDGIDNNCNGQTDEDRVCGNCQITESIKENCDENTHCDTCFFIGGEKYICISDNGSEFEWKKESDIICDSKREGYVIRCQNRCSLCNSGLYSEPFIINNESCDNKDNNCNAVTDEGDICSTYEVCINGKCTEKPCMKNEECPPGKICKNNKCTSCTDKTDDNLCGTGKICVNSACIEGNCHQDSDCSSGICISNKCCTDCCREKKDCPTEQICKQSKCTQCTDVIEDLSCGLGYICEDKKCIEGNCHPSIGCLLGKICVNYKCCDPGLSCCNEDKHCKANMTCNQAHICECKSLFGDCDNNYGDGCEKDLSSDINNCGLCNQKCALANADPKCVLGECQIKNCKTGFKDCNNKHSDGCEINITNDKINCSDCNIQCVADNADTKCEQSKCLISACKLGFADCDNKYETGCEIDIYNDDNNCGVCNKKCSELSQGTHCINGECK